jgi:Ni/Fe-hydrogenase 1 B-type cytochrome subunit
MTTEKTALTLQDTHSPALRIWHWGSALTIMALLCTVLISSTLLDTGSNIPVIQDKLNEKGVVITRDVAKAVAKKLENQVWQWHKYLGVALSFLFLFRIIIEIALPKGMSLKAKIRKALFLRKAEPANKNIRHYLWVKLVYLFFYLLIFTLVLTGYGIIYAGDVEVLKPIKGTLKDIHSFCMYGVITFIILHIGGILRAELTDEPGISSVMIHGGKLK